MNLLKTASMIVVITLIGRMLGFIRTLYVSHLYGTGMEADAYFLALTIPMTLFMIIPGAINAVLIPTMRGILEENQLQKASILYHKMLALITFSFFALTVAGYFLSPQIALMYGVSGEKAALTIRQLQLMWPSVFFIGLAGLWASVLNAHHHFFTSTLGTVANSVIVILAMVALVPIVGVDGLSIATTLGYVAALVVMWPAMRKYGYSQRFNLQYRQDAELRSMGERVVPILIGSVISQTTTFLERGLTTGLGDGKVAALSYANQIAQLPMAIFVGAFTLPLFPLLANYVKRKEMHLMKATLEKGLSYLLILLFPVTIGFILYGENLISILFVRQSGAFNEEALSWTAFGLIFYGMGLYFLAARDLITRAFYALENTRTPVIVGVIGIGVYLLTAKIFTPLLEHGGVALSASVSAMVQSILLFLLLWRSIGQLLTWDFLLTVAKVLIACAVMSVFALILRVLMLESGRLIDLLVGGTVSTVIYFTTLLILREPLVKDIVGKIAGRFLKK
ncbi:murein biosynthesis integral membrane protein MurJ [Brevibacillus laterosporus]|uniref:Probable lipid II flippase MurJ n=1 Tax=Brevibacillus laterosporus TaxID=1465 RepID=A0AAP3DE56_BRELA|nr:murein biosynthesis integral membrane protein MurJ [Brevibacillus laterosporus]MCR8979584.1 murein biosynthesis integral membrane protein MurJ [Brevibacillus laterosporus]MCZ0806739.1 murein biosynthesis integral membrane protein MurJ [Brevibacillus laterosporus]MCZ0825737.1 murein biosynthesis integral membrane protein MurJ [Brevibacillus laterosporus]MCZ0849515.1 murein biosynthesis integral membrane protein MurJ [Brevibacillus laterosporus]